MNSSDIDVLDSAEIDKAIKTDPSIEDLMRPVAQVAMFRLESLDGIPSRVKREAMDTILMAARAGLLRVQGMSHPVDGKLVREWRNLDDIAVPLRIPGGIASTEQGDDTGRIVPDVYILKSESSFLEPWDPGTSDDSVDILAHYCVTQMSWDEDFRIVHKAEMLGGPVFWEYGYDHAGRLTEVRRNGAVTERYTYDTKARRASDESAERGMRKRQYSYAADDRLLQAGKTRCLYDENGALSEKWLPAREPGLAATDAGAPYRLTHSGGRIMSVTTPGGKLVRYEHDDHGRRVKRLVNGELAWEYEWLDMVRLATVRDLRLGVSIDFVYGVDDGEKATRIPLFADVRNGEGRDGGQEITKRYTLVFDQLGSLRAVKDEYGFIVKEVEYDAFGNVTRDSRPDIFLPIGFAGGITDPAHDFILFCHRSYDPDTARWTAKDPIGYAGGDPDLYGYCNDDPVNRVDALGLFSFRKGSRKIPDHFIPTHEEMRDHFIQRTLTGTNPVASLGAVVNMIPTITTEDGENSASYYARRQVDTGNPLYAIPGVMASMWTPDTAGTTATVLGAALGTGAIGRIYRSFPANTIIPLSRRTQIRFPQNGQRIFQAENIPSIGKPLVKFALDRHPVTSIKGKTSFLHWHRPLKYGKAHLPYQGPEKHILNNILKGAASLWDEI